MHDISNLTPLGAAVHAMLRSMQGSFPTIGSLAVMAALAVVFGIVAVKLFRWSRGVSRCEGATPAPHVTTAITR
jgi:ABC-type multidrug transport system permease subunit